MPSTRRSGGSASPRVARNVHPRTWLNAAANRGLTSGNYPLSIRFAVVARGSSRKWGFVFRVPQSRTTHRLLRRSPSCGGGARKTKPRGYMGGATLALSSHRGGRGVPPRAKRRRCATPPIYRPTAHDGSETRLTLNPGSLGESPDRASATTSPSRSACQRAAATCRCRHESRGCVLCRR
jgi:hypothetical protein